MRIQEKIKQKKIKNNINNKEELNKKEEALILKKTY